MDFVSTVLIVVLAAVYTFKDAQTANETDSCEFSIMPTSQVVTLNTMAEFHCETPTGIHPSFRVNNQSPTRVPLPGVTLCNSTEASTIKIIIQATSNYNNSIISCVYVVDPELHILCCSDPEAILTITDSEATPTPTSATSDEDGTQDSATGGGKGYKARVGDIIRGPLLLVAALLTAFLFAII